MGIILTHLCLAVEGPCGSHSAALGMLAFVHGRAWEEEVLSLAGDSELVHLLPG